jgi:hypothetical protein
MLFATAYIKGTVNVAVPFFCGEKKSAHAPKCMSVFFIVT